MSDDRLLFALGELAREQRQEKTPPSQLLAPPGDAVKERIVAQAIAAAAVHPTGEVERVAALASPRTRPRPRRWLWLGAPAALAAGVALWLHQGGGTGSLPKYAMEVSGGVAEYRGGAAADDQPLVIEAGSAVEIRLRPAVDSAQPVVARAFWVRGNEVRPWAAQVATSPQGAVRMRGPGERPFGAGNGELVSVVAAAVPGDVSAAVLAAPPSGWQLFRRRVRWR